MWLLTYNGTAKSFAAWGLSSLRRTRVSQAQDTVSFSCPGPYDAAELFPYGSAIAISYQDSQAGVTGWFAGRVIKVPRSGSGSEESMDYVLAGPWWYLDNLVYQQEWNIVNPAPPPATISSYKSRVILGQHTTGARRSSGEVISDVLAYAIASGAPITIGTIEPSLQIAFDEQHDITCAEVIRRMLRWSPDAVTWFDYSTTPYPTFHCARRSALSSLSLNLTPSTLNHPPSTISITPRPDLQVPAVVLKFEQTNTVDGVDYESITLDKYPAGATGREFGALTATLQLAGFKATNVSQAIKTSNLQLPGLAANEAFWRAHDPSIADAAVFELSFLVGGGSADPIYPRELTEGQVQAWMTGVHAGEYTVTAVCLVTINDGNGDPVTEEWRTLSCKIIVTDATTKTYHALASLIAGEPIPTGLAQALYNSLNPLHYEGSITLTEEECCASGVGAALRAATGFTLNLSGGLAAWSAMNALIQKIEEDVDNGHTTISFGPAEHLSPQDLVERLRANRGRAIAENYEKRITGLSESSASTIALSGPTPILNTSGASGRTKMLIISNA